MKKRGVMQQKIEEIEYVSAHRGGRFSKLQKSLRELEKFLKCVEIGKRK